MADDKITIVDLRKTIAKQTNVEEAQVNAFLNQLIATIKDGLKKDKQVKISGLGTFKLQWVEPRKSVNISTGEPILIEGYQKISFTPEQSVKERINEPYADLVPVELDAEGNPLTEQHIKTNPMQKFDEQALEIKDLLVDLGADMSEPAAAEEVAVITHTDADATKEEIAAAEPADAAEAAIEEAPAEEPTVEPTESTDAAIEEAPAEEPTAEPISKEEEKERKEEKKEQKEKPFRGWLVALITVATLICMLFIAALFLQNKIEEWADMLNGKISVPERTAEATETAYPFAQESAVANFSTDSLQSDTMQLQSVQEEQTQDSPAPQETVQKTDFYKERVYTEFIGMETVREGSRLTWIAKKHYGSKDLWVFIYEANRDKIKNPSTVPIGTVLKIPALPKEVFDPDNMRAQHLIIKLQEQYLNQ